MDDMEKRNFITRGDKEITIKITSENATDLAQEWHRRPGEVSGEIDIEGYAEVMAEWFYEQIKWWLEDNIDYEYMIEADRDAVEEYREKMESYRSSVYPRN